MVSDFCTDCHLCCVVALFKNNFLLNISLVSCKQEEFKCPNGYGCVEPDNVCDGFNDCLHGSEEDACKSLHTF